MHCNYLLLTGKANPLVDDGSLGDGLKLIFLNYSVSNKILSV